MPLSYVDNLPMYLAMKQKIDCQMLLFRTENFQNILMLLTLIVMISV